MKKTIYTLILFGVLLLVTACSSKNESNAVGASEQKESTGNTAEANGKSEEGKKGIESLLKGSSAEEYFDKICEADKMEKYSSKKPDEDKEGNIVYTYQAAGPEYSKGIMGNLITLLSNDKDEITFIQLQSHLSEESFLRTVFSELNFEGKDDAFMAAADKYVNDIVSNGKAVDGKKTMIGNIMCEVELHEDEDQSIVLHIFASGD